MLAERRLQIEVHLEQYQAVVQEHLHGHRHVSEHVKFPKQQYKVTTRSLQNLMMLTTSWKLRSWGWSFLCSHIIEGKRRRRCKTRLNATHKSVGTLTFGCQARREREDCVGVPRSALAECTAGDLVATEQQRDRGRVLVFTVHSATHLALSTSQFHAHHNNNKETGALTLSSSCLDGSVTPVGPGQNPQYTGAPKAGGGCGLLDKSTTTSPMAQPQCSKKQYINVNKRKDFKKRPQRGYRFTPRDGPKN